MYDFKNFMHGTFVCKYVWLILILIVKKGLFYDNNKIFKYNLCFHSSLHFSSCLDRNLTQIMIIKSLNSSIKLLFIEPYKKE